MAAGVLFKRTEEEQGWVAGLRRPGGAFGQFQYLTVPLGVSDEFRNRLIARTLHERYAGQLGGKP